MFLQKNIAVLFLIALTRATNPGQASNFDVDPAVADNYACGSACQANLKQTNAGDLEIFGTSFDFDFYATAKNFSTSRAGDLLKIQPISTSDLSVPPGVAVYKFQYTSADLNGSLVPSTGFVAFPFARTDKPFKLVAYAHGTSGVFQGCAPSTSAVLFDYQSWTPLVLAGYAVVATDYAGLGNNYTAHKYLSSAAQANDIYYSVMAARKAFGNAITKEWVSVGHSQGGGATWKLSEHKLVQDSKGGYLGGVSVAPVSTLYDALALGFQKLQNVTNIHAYKLLGELPSAAIGVQAVFPDYKAPVLSAEMRQRIELARIGQYCDTALSGLTQDLPLEKLISGGDIAADTTLKAFQKLNAPAQGDSASKPLLLIQGLVDTIVFQEVTKAAFNDSCRYGNGIHLSLYPGLDHTAALTASAPEWLRFIEGLFAGRGVRDGCSQTTITPFDLAHASTPLDTV